MQSDTPQESKLFTSFYPFTLTRSAGKLLFGMRPLEEKWSWISEKKIDYPWDLVSHNTEALTFDFNQLALDVAKEKPEHVRTIGNHPLYISNTARIEHCTINTTDGPVYIDDHVWVMDGSMLRGPLFIGKHTVVKMGTVLYGGTSIGNHCVVGGEIKNTIMHDYSNKAHHGYIGDSIIGSWCNLGAGTSCSNVKNTAGKIKVWDVSTSSFVVASNKIGVFIGDHVKTAINTSLNSGTVIGPFSSLFSTNDLSEKFIPTFSWGGGGSHLYHYDELIKEIKRWMNLKGQSLDEETEAQIHTLYFQKQPR